MRTAWNKTHGLSQSTEYKSWLCMMHRCNNPKDPAYHNYGARGIQIEDAWHDFLVFKADMGPKPAGASLDRIDNNGPYCKANCRWATKLEQTNNTRATAFVSWQGQKKSVAEWCREFGVHDSIVRKRLARGWEIERALTEGSHRPKI